MRNFDGHHADLMPCCKGVLCGRPFERKVLIFSSEHQRHAYRYLPGIESVCLQRFITMSEFITTICL